VKGRFLKFNPRGMIIREANDLHHGEIRIHDPECRPVTVSTKSFGVAASKEKLFPRVRISLITRSIRTQCFWYARSAIELSKPPAGTRQSILR
jgi:hypothetical protein